MGAQTVTCLPVFIIWAASSEFVSSSIPSWQILTAHAQPFRGARDLAFCLKVPLDSLLIWASSGGSGETARMRRLAWTFAARLGDKYQIRLTRSIYYLNGCVCGWHVKLTSYQLVSLWYSYIAGMICLSTWLTIYVFGFVSFATGCFRTEKKIKAVTGQSSSSELSFANKAKTYFRAKNKRRKITAPWNIDHCDLDLFLGQRPNYTGSFS